MGDKPPIHPAFFPAVYLAPILICSRPGDATQHPEVLAKGFQAPLPWVQALHACSGSCEMEFGSRSARSTASGAGRGDEDNKEAEGEGGENEKEGLRLDLLKPVDPHLASGE